MSGLELDRTIDPERPWREERIIAHSNLLAGSFHRWTGQNLLAPGDGDLAERLYHAPFVLVSHGIETDPLFSYGNLAAQRLWELGWDEFTGMPSRKSAEVVAQSDRSEALKTALAGGWVEGYTGIRISSSGRRFRIEDGIIWNLLDQHDEMRGQAATFSRWIFV